MTSQYPAPVESAKKRVLITVCADTSGSMYVTGAIHGLNRALKKWRESMRAYPSLQRVGEIALVSFGNRVRGRDGVDRTVVTLDPTGAVEGEVVEPFAPLSRFEPKPLVADGNATPMVAGIQKALEITFHRREQLEKAGIGMACRPLIYLVTDGEPSDDNGNPSRRWRDLLPQLRELEKDRKVILYAFGVGNAVREVLEEIAPSRTWPVEDVNFTDFLSLALASMDINATPLARDADLTADEIGQITAKRHRAEDEARKYLEVHSRDPQ